MSVAVFRFEMLNECVSAAVRLNPNSIQEIGKAIGLTLGQRSGVDGIGENPVALSMTVRQVGTDCDLYAFNCIQQKQPKLPVESISIPDFLNSGGGDKGVEPALRICCIHLPERIPITAETIVANGSETADDLSAISCHATFEK